jgi:type I restriction enzyme S subunit
MKQGNPLSLPKGWEKKTLGEVLVKTETTDPTKKPNEEFIYLDVSSVNKETKEIENATVLLGKDAPSRARKSVRTNDVIFATVRPTHSRVALITEEYDEQVCSTGYFVLRAKEFLSNNLVYYFLLTYGFNEQMEKLQKGASYPAVTDSEVKGIYIPFPKSLPEQQRIVVILDEAFAAIAKALANAEQNLKNSKELFESYLQGVFDPSTRSGQGNKGKSWESKELIEVCEQITDGSHFSPKSSGEDEYPYITVRDIDEDIIDFDNCKFICKKDYQSLLKNGCKPNSGDLLFSKDGTVGKVSLVDFEKDFVVLSSLAIIRPKSKIILSPLLKYILKDPLFLKTAIGMKTGVAIRRIILKNLKLIVISFPKSLKEQQTIVQKLDALSNETKKLEAIYKQKINDLEELKKSVLQKAFSGELRGGEPVEPKTEKKL